MRLPRPTSFASFSHGVAPYRYSPWPGNYGVAVDRYTGRTHMWMPEQEDRTLTSAIWQTWVGFGLAPLLLAVTGITTWMRRRRGRSRRTRASPS